MRRDYPVDSAPVQFGKYCLGDCTSGSRLCSRPEFVYEDEGAAVGLGEHLLHVRKERTVGTQVILYGLVVPDAHHDPVKDHHFRCLGSRNGHSPLEHILKKSHCLQAYRLASGIRPGDEEYVFLRCQSDRQRNYCLVFFLESPFKKRMPCLAEIDFPFRRYDRHSGHYVKGCLRLRHKEIHLPEIFCGHHEIRGIRAEEITEFKQNLEDFPAFGEFESLDLIVKFNNLGGFYESRLSGSRLVIYEARKLFLVCGRDRNEHLAVADRNPGIGIGYPLFLSLAEDGIDSAGYDALLFLQAPPYLIESVRSRVLHLPKLVQDIVDSPLHFRERQYRGRHPLEVRIDFVSYSFKKRRHPSERLKHCLEFSERQQVNGRGRFFQRNEESQAIDVSRRRKTFLKHEDKPHLVSKKLPPAYFRDIRHKLLLPGPCRGILCRTPVGYLPPYLVKPEFLFQSGIRLHFLPP